MADIWELLGAAFSAPKHKTVREETGGKPKASPTPSWMNTPANGRAATPQQMVKTGPQPDRPFSPAYDGKVPDWLTKGHGDAGILQRTQAGPEVNGGFLSKANKGLDPHDPLLIGTDLDPNRSKALDLLPTSKDYVDPKQQQAAKYQAELHRVNQGLHGNARFEQEELTESAYNALSPQQRAAVDANTELVKAIQLDRGDAGKSKTVAEAHDADYDARIAKLFGADGGSNAYSPHTLAVIEKLGLGSKTNDLDNFLDLSALVTDKDMASIGGTPAKGDVRAEHSNAFASSATKTLAQTLAHGQTLIDSMRAAKGGDKLWGGGELALGSDPTNERDGALERAFTAMGDKTVGLTDQELSEGLGQLQADYGLDSQKIFDYFERRLKQLDYESASGGKPPADFMNAAEFRSRYYTGGK